MDPHNRLSPVQPKPHVMVRFTRHDFRPTQHFVELPLHPGLAPRHDAFLERAEKTLAADESECVHIASGTPLVGRSVGCERGLLGEGGVHVSVQRGRNFLRFAESQFVLRGEAEDDHAVRPGGVRPWSKSGSPGRG